MRTTDPGAVLAEAYSARTGIRSRLKVGEVVRSLRWRAGRVGEENEGGRLGGLLGKGVVKDQAEHAAAGDIIGAHRDLVGLALPVPFDRNEALLGELVLRCARVLSEKGGFRPVLDDALGQLFGRVVGLRG